MSSMYPDKIKPQYLPPVAARSSALLIAALIGTVATIAPLSLAPALVAMYLCAGYVGTCAGLMGFHAASGQLGEAIKVPPVVAKIAWALTRGAGMQMKKDIGELAYKLYRVFNTEKGAAADGCPAPETAPLPKVAALHPATAAFRTAASPGQVSNTAVEAPAQVRAPRPMH